MERNETLSVQFARLEAAFEAIREQVTQRSYRRLIRICWALAIFNAVGIGVTLTYGLAWANKLGAFDSFVDETTAWKRDQLDFNVVEAKAIRDHMWDHDHPGQPRSK